MKRKKDIRVHNGIATMLGLLLVGSFALFLSFTSILPSMRVAIYNSAQIESLTGKDTGVPANTAIDKAYYDQVAAQAASVQNQFDASITRLMWMSGGILLLVAALGGIGAYVSSGRTLKPFRFLSEQVKLSNGETGDPILLQGPTREVRDLTQSFNTMLAKLENAATTQKRFNAAVAHELKTPLAVIKTHIDVLNDQEFKSVEDYRQTMGVIESSIRKMNALIDALLDSIQVESAGLDDQVSLDMVLSDVMEDLSIYAAKHEVALTGEIPSVDKITGNEVLVYRAIYNIVENAIKYNHAGGQVDLHLSQEKEWITIHIKDTGIGIAKENTDLIFEPFYRVKSQGKTEGFGLGLAMAKSFLKMHGATIEIQSEPGQGSEFILRFPK
ncbi:MAG: HAMP domain-containing sensor histidine kinase [Erysipelotrichaceae bacterium]